jgi:uncharacterized protein YcbK (DUF882 family)
VIPVPRLGAIARAALSPDGRRVALADRAGRAVIVGLTSDQVVARLDPRPAVRALAFAADGRLVGGGADGSVRIWSPAGRPLAVLRDNGPRVRDLAVGGGQVAVGGESSKIELLPLAEGRPRRAIDSGSEWVRALAFSPDGRWLAAGGHEGTVRLFEVASGRLAGTASGHGLWISALAFGPAGARLASAGFDKSVRIWAVGSNGALTRRHLLRGHVRRVVSLAFSPRGALLASAGLDRRVLVWDPARGRLAHELAGHRRQVSAVAFDPGGRFILSAGGDGTLRIWPVPPPVSGSEAPLPPPRPGEVTFRNNTTGERQRIRLVDEAGALLDGGRRGLAQVLRSGPDDATTEIDPRLAGLIYRIADHFGREHEVIVISGFRSPRYNQLRRRQSRQVAEKSRHLRGEAADLRIDGVSITALRDYVIELGAGGVGFYADSQFVHVDVGPVRQWSGD